MAQLAEALAWAARDLPVFPLPYGSKRPSFSFPEQATTDQERIKLFWRDPVNPAGKEYNIGVLCGNGLALLDIDTKKDAQFNRSALKNYLAAGGHFETLTVRTGSGGYQCYFKLPPGFEAANAVDIVPGVDVRCQNGYGIAPGSFAMETGGAYELHVDMPPAPIPPALLRLLKPVTPKKDRLNGRSDGDKAIPLYVDYLKRVEPAIEGQHGDTHTYNVACMGCIDYGLSSATVASLMAEHFNERCVPPWEFDDLVRKAENAEQYGVGKFASRTPDVLLDNVFYKPPTTAPGYVPPASPIVTVTNNIDDDSLLEPDQIPVARWLMHPLLTQGVVSLLIGPSGVGKSAFLIAMAAHMAVGRSFGPYSFSAPIECVLFNPEDDKPHISGRAAVTCQLHKLDFKEVTAKFKVFAEDNFNFALVEPVGNSGKKFQIPEAAIRFLRDYKAKHPDCKVMIFDPLRKFLDGIDENSNGHMSAAFRLINWLAKELDVAILITHHTPKGYMQRKDLDPTNPDAASGAGAIVSSSRLTVNMLPQTPQEAEMQGKRDDLFSIGVTKNSHGPKGKPSWWCMHILTAKNGQQYPTVAATDVHDAMNKVHKDYIFSIGDYMLDRGINAFNVSQAGALILTSYQHGRSQHTTTEMLRIIFKRGEAVHQYVDPMGNTYNMVLDVTGKSHVFTLIETPGQLPRPAPLIIPKQKEEGNE